MMVELKYPLFDGERVWDGACVTVEDGMITSVKPCEREACGDGFLMPGLIDAHTHMETMDQARSMTSAGITATFDVNGNASLVRDSRDLRIVSSAGMAMGIVMNPGGFVERAAQSGARYIKVLLFGKHSVGRRALNGIVRAAHERGLKVAVHATETETVRQAVDAGADILLHVPMKEKYPEELAQEIAEKRIAVAPTLVMMETFANSRRNGYRPEHYRNAEDAVSLLHRCGVQILVATDANSGSFAPAVAFGSSIHREMGLLVRCGLTPAEVLAGATGRSVAAFGIDRLGMIQEGWPADLLLVGGRPDQTIADTALIRQLWVGGKQII